MRPCPPRKCRKHFLTRYTVKNGISNLYILLKSALKMPFQRPKFPGGHAPGPPYNWVVTMASPSLKSWPRHSSRVFGSRWNGSRWNGSRWNTENHKVFLYSKHGKPFGISLWWDKIKHLVSSKTKSFLGLRKELVLALQRVLECTGRRGV